MAKKEITLSLLNVAVLSNRILNACPANSKADIAKDNIIYADLLPHVDAFNTINKEGEEKRQVIFKQEITDKEKQAGIILLNTEVKRNQAKEVKVQYEVEIFTYLTSCFETGITNLIEADKKLEIDKRQFNAAFKIAIGQIDEALINALPIK